MSRGQDLPESGIGPLGVLAVLQSPAGGQTFTEPTTPLASLKPYVVIGESSGGQPLIGSELHQGSQTWELFEKGQDLSTETDQEMHTWTRPMVS